MVRLLASCAVVAILASSALASRQAPPARADLKHELWSATFSPELAATLARPAATASASEGMVINDDTAIHLDGKPCSFTEVPSNAIIESVRLGPDNKTIQAIRFRSKR